MQTTVITPQQFKTIPWKNGKGNTIELAINRGATLDSFDWRISMADVVEDGEFSDFSGYLRHLVLIKGEAITLKHDQQAQDQLTSYLSVAKFDGANKTFGHLPNGPITDFNIITRDDRFHVEVFTSVPLANQQVSDFDIAFVYGLQAPITVELAPKLPAITLPAQHLLMLENNQANQVERSHCNAQVMLSGSEMIIVCLKQK